MLAKRCVKETSGRDDTDARNDSSLVVDVSKWNTYDCTAPSIIESTS